MAEFSDLDPTDANNTARWPENMQFRNVNNAGRADEGMIARHYRDTNCSLAASGSSGNYAVTANRTISAYADSLLIGFTANHVNTGSATLAVSGLAAKTIVRPNGDVLLAGDIQANQKVLVIYNAASDKFQLVTMPATAAAISIAVGAVMAWPTENIPTGTLLADGSAVSRTTYAALFAAYGTRYGVGDGSTTFNVPNYKDYFLRGHDAAGTDAGTRTDRGDGTTGANVGTKQAGATKEHTHTATSDVTDPGHVHTIPGADHILIWDDGFRNTTALSANVIPATSTSLYATIYGTSVQSGTTGITVATTNANAGESANETRPKNVTVNWIIIATPAAALAVAGIGKCQRWVGARHMTSRAANGAASGTRDSGTSDITQPVFDFDAAADEFVQFEAVPPKRWDKGTVTATLYWTNDAGLTTETVRWTAAGVAISNDDALNAAFGTAVNIDDTWLAQGDLHIAPESGAITLGGSPALADLIVFQIGRDVSEDNLTGDARLLGALITWTYNAVSDD